MPIPIIHPQSVYQLQQQCQLVTQKQSRRLPQIPQNTTTSITTTTISNCTNSKNNYLLNNQIIKNYESDCNLTVKESIKSQRLIEFMNNEKSIYPTLKQQIIPTSNSVDKYSVNNLIIFIFK